MRIAVVAGYAPSLINFRAPLLRALRARGHEVVALAPSDSILDLGPGGSGGMGGDVRGALADLGIELLGFPMRRGGVDPAADARTLLALRAQFRRIRPELVLPYTIKPVIYGSLAARMSGDIPVASLITGLGYAFGGGGGGGGGEADPGAALPLGRRVLRDVVVRLYRGALSNNRVVFFQNPDDRELFRDMGILGQGQRVCVVNGSGVDLAHFSPAPPVMAHEFTGAPVFLCMARLLWAKGVGVYVEACRQLKARHPQAVCRLLGAPDRVADAVPPEMLERWRQDRVVEFLDPVADVRPQLAASSVFVLPSFREGTPRSSLEAMAMARPVVTTDVPGCRQTVEDGVTGLLVPPFEPGALMRAMARFVEEPELIPQMGAAARRLAEEKFGADEVALSMLRALGLAGGD